MTTDGSLELFFLGSGNAFSVDRAGTNFLIVCGEDHLLVDLGTSGPAHLESVAGLTLLDIDTFLPTHAHADHVGGLEQMLVFNRYRGVLPGNRRKLRIVATPELEEFLWLNTLRGGLGYNEEGMDGSIETFRTYADVLHPVASETATGRIVNHVEVGSIRLELFETTHVQGLPSSDGRRFLTYGLLINDRVFFSGDTVYDRDLIEEYSTRCDWLIHDVSLVETPLHASLDELRGLPDAIKQRMLLCHYPPEARSVEIDDFHGLVEPGDRYMIPS